MVVLNNFCFGLSSVSVHENMNMDEEYLKSAIETPNLLHCADAPPHLTSSSEHLSSEPRPLGPMASPIKRADLVFKRTASLID